MNNEPVAWMRTNKQWRKEVSFVEKEGFDIPLYTHPVKEQGNPVAWRSQDPDGYWSVYQAPVEGAEPLYTGFRELTDEEIISTMVQFDVYSSDDHLLIEAGRAILRKAQEK